MKIQDKNNMYKETLTILGYFDKSLMEKIPTKVLKKLLELAAESKENFYVDIEKNLDEQNISEETKDMLSLIYYNCIADENEKKALLKLWNENEIKYQQKLNEKYGLDNIFKSNKN